MTPSPAVQVMMCSMVLPVMTDLMAEPVTIPTCSVKDLGKTPFTTSMKPVQARSIRFSWSVSAFRTSVFREMAMT